MITENLSTLELNKLSSEQYSRELLANNLNNNALYLTPEVSALPTEGYSVTDYTAANSGYVIYFFEASEIYNLTLDVNEHLIYVPLANGNNITLNGHKVYFTTLNSLGINEITYRNGINWESLSNITDGRCFETGQILTLLVRGSGTAGVFDYVRLLSLPPAPIKIPDFSPIVEYAPIQVYAGNNNIVLETNSKAYQLTMLKEERIVYIVLGSNLTLNGKNFTFATSGNTNTSLNQLTYQTYSDTFLTLDTIADNRGFNASQTLTLHVKGSGTAGKFEFVRLLNLPYPAAESMSF